LAGVQAWATDTEFAYDDGRLYVQDARLTWRDAAAVLRMPRGDSFFVPLRVEGWSAPPPPDLDGWDHVVEFPLPVPSGTLALASDGCGDVTVTVGSGVYRARWSAAVDDDVYRLQLWPGEPPLPAAELKPWAPERPYDELGDLPALLGDERLGAVGSVVGAARSGGALDLSVRVANTHETWERTIHCTGVVHWTAAGRDFKHAAIHSEHPDLRPFSDPRGSLSFRGRASDPEGMLEALRAVHPDIYGDFTAAVNPMPGLLTHSFGRLAEGPVSLLERYARVAAGYGVATHLTLTAPARNGLRLLDLEHSQVVAERFKVE
jgi:hypothetical protein